jgi:hypothetical protein
VGNPQSFQTIGSRIKELFSAEHWTAAPRDSLCSICTNLFGHESIFHREATHNEEIEMGFISEVTTRAYIDKCPLCRVSLHIVSQALASPQSSSLWPQADLKISLTAVLDHFERLQVWYDTISVGFIAVFSRTPTLHRSLYWRDIFPTLGSIFDMMDCHDLYYDKPFIAKKGFFPYTYIIFDVFPQFSFHVNWT